MGRTLYYAVHDDLQRYWEARKDIRIAQELLIYRFTWTSEWPVLRLIGEGERLRREDRSDSKRLEPIPIAEGFTKVCGDEWNAALLARFMTWVSRRLPHARVEIRDEGDYLSAGDHVIRNGVTALDEDRVAHETAYLTEHEHRDRLRVYENAVRAFRRGDIHRPTQVGPYADYAEIEALGLQPEVLARMTLDEVADRITFPWTTEGLGGA